MRVVLTIVLSLVFTWPAWAGSKIDLNQSGGGITELGGNGPAANVHNYTLLAGEDQTNNLIRVEHQYSRGLSAGTDTLIKSGAGFVHGVTCWGSDAAATAGDIAIRDATSAGAGTIILQFQIAAALLLPQPVILDVPVTTGVYADYTTTADVTCTFSYR